MGDRIVYRGKTQENSYTTYYWFDAFTNMLDGKCDWFVWRIKDQSTSGYVPQAVIVDHDGAEISKTIDAPFPFSITDDMRAT